MEYADIPIIKKIYELYKILHFYQKNIPKFEKYSIWQKIIEVNFTILEKLIELGNIDPANHISRLKVISTQVDLLKLLVRLAYETKAIDNKKYILIQKHINEAGRMLGGWIKSIKK